MDLSFGLRIFQSTSLLVSFISCFFSIIREEECRNGIYSFGKSEFYF